MGDQSREFESHIAHLVQEVDPEFDADEEWLASLSDDDRRHISRTETLREIIYEFGGPSGVAKELRATYKKAPPGSVTRARIVDNIYKGITEYGEDEAVGDEESIEALEEHLRAMHFDEFLAKLPADLREQVQKCL